MRTRFFAPLVMFMVLCLSSQGLAYKVNHYREEPGIRNEAYTRKVWLIPIASAQTIAAKQIGSSKVTFSSIELFNRVDMRTSSADFRPAYKLECRSGGQVYLMEIDASTGQVLTFR